MRILIVGSPGVGKTTFARQLKEKLKLPLYHLDDMYWQKNWQRPTYEQWTKRLDELLEGSKWIIDGNYFDTFEKRLSRSDHVIYLDFSTALCLYRASKRALKRVFYSKDSLPEAMKNDSCYEPSLTFNLKFLLLIALFKMKYRPKMMNLLQRYKVSYIVLKNPQEAEAVLFSTKKISDDHND